MKTLNLFVAQLEKKAQNIFLEFQVRKPGLCRVIENLRNQTNRSKA